MIVEQIPGVYVQCFGNLKNNAGVELCRKLLKLHLLGLFHHLLLKIKDIAQKHPVLGLYERHVHIIVHSHSPGSQFFMNTSRYEAPKAKKLYHCEACQMPETIIKSTSVGAST